jgi:predicted lipoprotein with Yx(FWY)xxD motif
LGIGDWAQSPIPNPQSPITIFKINCQDDLPFPEPITPTLAPEETPTPPRPSPAPSTPTPSRSSPIRTNVSTIAGVAVGNDPRLGQYLTNDQGYTLYVNAKSGPNNIECYGDCLRKWPPAMITENQKITVADEVNGDKLFNIKGDDGRLQIAYFDYPLYYFALDVEPESKKGQGVDNFFMISPKGQILKPDASGRVPTPPRNATERNERPEEPSSDEDTSDKGKTLSITGTASMNIIPDLVSIKFSLSSSGENLKSAFEQINDSLKFLNRTLSNVNGIDPSKIMLIDKIINQDLENELNPQINIFYLFDMIALSPNNLQDLLQAIKNFNSQRNNTLAYDVSYSVSNDVLKKAKENLFSTAMKNAMENSFNSLDPAGLSTKKDRPIRSITLDSAELSRYMPFFNPTTSTYMPSINKFNLDQGNEVKVKVTILYNIN